MHPYLCFFLLLVITHILSSCHSADATLASSPTQAEILLDARVLHPRFRDWPAPSAGKLAQSNPPVLLWPVQQNPKRTYDVRLSQQADFPPEATQGKNDSPFAIYHPHRKLATGRWYWQYRVSNGAWSEVQSFEISQDTPVFETPTTLELHSAIPLTRPRILATPTALDDMRERAQQSSDAEIIIRRAQHYMLAPIPDPAMAIPSLSSADPVEQNKHEKDASKQFGTALRKGLEYLCQAYLLTNDQAYAQAAIRWAVAAASTDPDGPSMENNFGDSNIMLGLAMAYDSCYDFLSEAEKAAIRKNIYHRAHRFYLIWVSQLEAKVFSGHVWQHILERLFKTAIAMKGELPEADQWLSFLYEIWLARAPVLGPEDGGWWNGGHYIKLNALTLMEIPKILEDFTGTNFMHAAFYQNLPYWLIYTFPAHSYSEGFGNGTEKQHGQKLGTLAWMDALAREKQLPYAAWYADHHLREMKKTLAEDDEFRWYRLRWPQANLPDIPARLDLPLARVFRETGSVNMHTHLEEASHNLMLSMRASPFGSTSHAHANQNSFNIQYGGEKLFYNSGYRPSMGVPHYTKWFKASIGHNTILIDGKGQPIGVGESYGWIPRFAHGKRISYALGDASKAYDNVKEASQQAGLTRYRRHLIFLRPSTIVVYDELAADHKAEWSWLLHSHEAISVDQEAQMLSCDTRTARSQVHLWGSKALDIELSTQFDPKPVNYRKIKDAKGNLVEFKDQWHIYARPAGKVEQMRYMAIFQIKDKLDQRPFEMPQWQQDSSWQVGSWRIQAEMDATLPASFSITHIEEKRAIVYNQPALQLGEQRFHPEIPGSTLLIEQVAGQWLIKEAVDVLPKAVAKIP